MQNPKSEFRNKSEYQILQCSKQTLVSGSFDHLNIRI
jgi:hypothetical protein